MKVKPETALFESPFGSHLYGTNGPTSDIDLKVVCLPSLDDLLLNKQLSNRKVKPGGDHEKLAPGDTETEYLPLQVFLDDYFNGQTYAIEVVFAVLQGKTDANPYHTSWCWRLAEDFTTRNIDKMVGYAVAQSRTYGLKTQRYTAMKEVVDAIDVSASKMQLGLETRIKDEPDLLCHLQSIDHVHPTMIENAMGGSALAPALEVCGKKFPLTNTWGTMVRSLRKSLLTYGERVKKFDGEGVDWKALSHAIRITEQVVELSRIGIIKFPRPNAVFLKAVKEGRIPLNEATDYLTQCFDEVDFAVEKSILHERTPELEQRFQDFKLALLRDLYNL